ncbi:uncharacterized protein LOC130648210 [Hydractinia symbiolongicarpus]|uniref:uncharacterized protein LOC130648210 n=1 Tax=Hydractinia symbiolongicarpus TaxID=13093 RepID=UPI00254FD559|nr:uncharacterized protein LOC130648210 [Hydractinia symbiolongicarpus]
MLQKEYVLIQGFEKRYMVCDQEPSLWENLLLTYRANKVQSTELVSFKLPMIHHELSLESQFFYISSIPNFHKWVWCSDEIKQVEVKYVQKFSTSCRRYPASPRNRILQACNFRGSEEASEVVIAVLNCILGNIVEIPYYKNKKLPSTTRKRKFHLISKRNNRKNAEESDGDEEDASDSSIQVDIMESIQLQNVASSSESLYQYFCGQLFNYGTFKWRVKSATKLLS